MSLAHLLGGAEETEGVTREVRPRPLGGGWQRDEVVRLWRALRWLPVEHLESTPTLQGLARARGVGAAIEWSQRARQVVLRDTAFDLPERAFQRALAEAVGQAVLSARTETQRATLAEVGLGDDADACRAYAQHFLHPVRSRRASPEAAEALAAVFGPAHDGPPTAPGIVDAARLALARAGVAGSHVMKAQVGPSPLFEPRGTRPFVFLTLSDTNPGGDAGAASHCVAFDRVAGRAYFRVATVFGDLVRALDDVDALTPAAWLTAWYALAFGAAPTVLHRPEPPAVEMNPEGVFTVTGCTHGPDRQTAYRHVVTVQVAGEPVAQTEAFRR